MHASTSACAGPVVRAKRPSADPGVADAETSIRKHMEKARLRADLPVKIECVIHAEAIGFFRCEL